jgi:hypothetical protein
VIDLNKAIDRLHQLDDQHLEDLVRRLDETLADCRSGPIDEDTQTTISVAGAARILLRNRRAARTAQPRQRHRPHPDQRNGDHRVNAYKRAALGYAAAGVRVFRVRPDKAPFANCGQCRPPTPARPNPAYVDHRPEDCRCDGPDLPRVYAATTDLDLIEQWWTEEPDANIGAPCALNGWAVLDVDPRHGGHLALAVLEERVGLLPGTVYADHGRGRAPHRVPQSRSVSCPAPSAPGSTSSTGYILLSAVDAQQRRPVPVVGRRPLRPPGGALAGGADAEQGAMAA